MSACCCTGPTTGDHLCPCQRRDEDARRTAQYWNGEHLAGNEQIAALQAKLDAVTKDARWLLDLIDENEGRTAYSLRAQHTMTDIERRFTDHGRAGEGG